MKARSSRPGLQIGIFGIIDQYSDFPEIAKIANQT
jgi:hypothetical protein